MPQRRHLLGRPSIRHRDLGAEAPRTTRRVHRGVPAPDDHDPLRQRRALSLVDPSEEVGPLHHGGVLLAGNAHAACSPRPEAEEDRIESVLQLGAAKIGADSHAIAESDPHPPKHVELAIDD